MNTKLYEKCVDGLGTPFGFATVGTYRCGEEAERSYTMSRLLQEASGRTQYLIYICELIGKFYSNNFTLLS